MKKLLLLCITAVMLCVIAGCGKTDDIIEETHVILDKKGQIVCTHVESFAEDFYDLQELQAMIDEEAALYNQANGEGTVVAEPAYRQADNVIDKVTYASFKDYNAFNERNIFVGTVAEAMEAGIAFRVALENIDKPGEFITADHMSDMNEYHVLIVDEPGVYDTFGKVMYISDGVSVAGKKSVKVSEDMEGLGYILFR